MNKKREALCEAASSQKGLFESDMAKFTSTCDYSMWNGYVSRFLLYGSGNAISTTSLMTLTGIKTSRDLQKAIEEERGCGIPILTKPGYHGGYFLPDEDPAIAAQECRAFIHYMNAKGIGCLRSMKPARKLLHQLELYLSGQEEMPDFRDDEAEAEELWERDTFTG